jgi:hypothetical protein
MRTVDVETREFEYQVKRFLETLWFCNFLISKCSLPSVAKKKLVISIKSCYLISSKSDKMNARRSKGRTRGLPEFNFSWPLLIPTNSSQANCSGALV